MVQCDPGSSSRIIDSDCGCHFLIEDYSVSTQYDTAVEVTSQVLACTDPSQVGKTHKEFFPCQGNQADKFLNLAEATGLVTAEQRKAATEAGEGLSVDETLLKGRQFCGQVKMEMNMTKDKATGELKPHPEKPGPYPRLGFRTFAVTSDRAKDIPKHQQFLGMLGGQATPPQQPQGTQQPAQSEQSADPAASQAGGMNW